MAKGDLRAVGEVPLIARLVLFHELSAPRHRIRNHARSKLGGKVLTSWRVIPIVKPVQDVGNEVTKLLVDLVGLDAAIVVAGHRAVPKS